MKRETFSKTPGQIPRRSSPENPRKLVRQTLRSEGRLTLEGSYKFAASPVWRTPEGDPIMADSVPYGRVTQKPSPVPEIHILWMTSGLLRRRFGFYYRRNAAQY